MQSAIIVHFEFYQHLIFSKQTEQKLDIELLHLPKGKWKKTIYFPYQIFTCEYYSK
jgi:hypothetical protein